LTTVFLSVDDKTVIARWYYGEDGQSVDNFLKTIDLNSIDNWEFALTLHLSSDKQYLIDSACSANMLDKNNDLLSLDIQQG